MLKKERMKQSSSSRLNSEAGEPNNVDNIIVNRGRNFYNFHLIKRYRVYTEKAGLPQSQEIRKNQEKIGKINKVF